MTLLRLLLTLIAVAAVSWGVVPFFADARWIEHEDFNALLTGAVAAFSGFAALTAILLFLLSFFTVSVDAAGTLRYDSRNFWWRELENFRNNWDCLPSAGNLCAAWWSTLIMLLNATTAIICFLGSAFFVWLAFHNPRTNPIDVALVAALAACAFAIALHGVTFPFRFRSHRENGLKATAWIVVAFVLLCALPVQHIMRLLDSGLAVAVGVWILSIVGIAAAIGAVIAVCWCVAKLCSMLSNGPGLRHTLLGQKLKALDERLCPNLTPL